MRLEAKKTAEADLYRKTKCRYCGTSLPEPFLDLGTMPLANSFLTKEQIKEEEFVCPLRLVGCSGCGLVQLTHVVPPDKMFSNYLYVSSTTDTFRKHFSDYAKEAKGKLLNKESPILAVDIGSNDGLLLSCYQSEGMKAVGVEPAKNLSEEANRKGLQTLNDYFGRSVVETLLQEFGPADIISANNVFAHIDEIQEVLRNVNRLLHKEGVFVIEFPYLSVMFEKMFFDMIYHEHLSYIAVKPLASFLGRFDLEIFDIKEVSSHGGSLRVFIQKRNGGRSVSREVAAFVQREEERGYASPSIYREFADRVYRAKENLISFVDKIKSQGDSISGYGAPAKGNTLINFCEFNTAQIEYIVDDNPLKQNLLTPGAHIPVVSSQYLLEKPADYIILFAWNFADEIVRKLDTLRRGGVKFIAPLPQPRLL